MDWLRWCVVSTGLSVRSNPGTLIPHPASVWGSSSSSSARQLPFKLLAAAAAVLMGAAALPAALSGFTQHLQQQQLPDSLPSVSMPAAAAAHRPSSSTAVGQDTGLQATPAAAAGLHGGKFSSWMHQQLPTVLQIKREQLQRLQGAQQLYGGMQGAGTVLRGMVPEAEAVFRGAWGRKCSLCKCRWRHWKQ
jgi:hypothetical protein